MLALPYKKYIYNYDGDFVVNGRPIFLGTAGTDTERKEIDGDTGCTVWDASVFLVRYFEANRNIVANKRIVELGSGLGLCGIGVHLCGAKQTILTDLPYVIESTKKNVEKSLGIASHCSAHILDWFEPMTLDWDVDLVIASDVVWIDKLVDPLVRTLNCTKTGTVVYLSNQQRSDAVLQRFEELIRNTFTSEIVKLENNLFIHKLIRK